MVAVRILNERKGRPIPVVHGAVTTGSEWLFLQLDGASISARVSWTMRGESSVISRRSARPRESGGEARTGQPPRGRPRDRDGPADA
jgi:hypothetical protein